MHATFKQSSSDSYLQVFIADVSGYGVPGLVFNSTGLSFLLSKGDSGAAAAYVPASGTDMVEVGGGTYKILLSAANVNTLGNGSIVPTYNLTSSPPCTFTVVANIESDTFARIGAPAGASAAADQAAIFARTDVATSTRLAPTVAARTLDVAATGEAGLDFDNIKDATGAHALTNITVPVVTTLTGHTPQTGDNFARLGAPAGASLAADIASIKVDTDPLPTDPADESLIIDATNAILTRLGAPAGASVSVDIAAVQTKLGAPAGASVSADIAAIKADTAALIVNTVKLLGLAYENVATTISYNVDGDVETLEIRSYDTAAHAVTDNGVLGYLRTWTATYTYDAPTICNGFKFVLS